MEPLGMATLLEFNVYGEAWQNPTQLCTTPINPRIKHQKSQQKCSAQPVQQRNDPTKLTT